MVTVAVRAGPAFVPALTVTVPLPAPDAALVTVSHDVSLLLALHVHQLPADIVIVAAPPPAANGAVDGEIAYVHGAAAWVTVTFRSAIVTVALRVPAVFAVASTVTVPFPLPDAPAPTVSHAVAPLTAVHVHDAPVATENAADPAADEIDCDGGETTKPHVGVPLI